MDGILEIKATEEMIKAGESRLLELSGTSSSAYIVKEVFEAMMLVHVHSAPEKDLKEPTKIKASERPILKHIGTRGG